MRAITMLLASPDVRVLGIVVSPGVLNTDSSFAKVESLLHSFHHEGIPIGINRISKFRSPDFGVALNASWGKPVSVTGLRPTEGNDLIREIMNYEKTKISFICLGSASMAASLSSDTLIMKRVKEIVWSVDASSLKNEFNYTIDIQSSEKIIKGKIPLKLVGGLKDQVFYDETFIKSVTGIPGVYSERVSSCFRSEQVKKHAYSYQATDEMVPLYLHYPELFVQSGDNKFLPLSDKTGLFREKALIILAGETVLRNQVIKAFPDDPEFYSDDLEKNVSEIIRKYGKDEWTSGVIANELHRHLGTYAIIGVKMGIRAREFFNTGVDEFRVVTYAGSIPPLSCMNDGLQVSTGATPGHGLLTVINENTLPSAKFSYLNHKIRLTLKPEIAEKISTELKELSFIYGLDSNIYWELVRKNTIKYWLELDRHEIFEIEELSIIMNSFPCVLK